MNTESPQAKNLQKRNGLFFATLISSELLAQCQFPAACKQPSVIVRRLGKERGGAELPFPSSLDELKEAGGVALRIGVAKVRRLGTEAEVLFLACLEDGAVVFLTTVEEEEAIF